MKTILLDENQIIVKKKINIKSIHAAKFSTTLFLLLLSVSLISCKKNKIPRVETISYLTVSPSSVELTGEVTDEGGAPIVDRGFCWGQMEMPTIEYANIEYVGAGMGGFSKIIENLEYNSYYYFRAFAKNKYGIVYGESVLIYTKGLPYTSASCNPQTNWAFFNLINLSYSPTANASSVGYNWTMRGNANYSDLNIHFSQEPVTGNYVTVNYTSDIGYSNCEVSGVFGVGFGYFYTAQAGDTVHVENDGNGHFSMSFCGLTFHSSGTTYTFTTDGNLTN